MSYDARDETVNGIIIGGDYVHWQLCYDEKPVMARATADDETSAMTCARMIKMRLIGEGAALGLYKDDSKWTMRIYD